MNTIKTVPTPRRDWRRVLRYLYRVPLLALYVLIGVLLCAVIIGRTRGAVAHDGHEPLAHRATRWWSRRMLRVFGFRTHAFGTAVPDAAMFVCNHVTWLDIALMHSQHFVCFVAKAEISRWPVVGWMAACGGTIFHQRGSTRSMATVLDAMVERMRAGRSVGVFPEGGTSHEGELRVFHARIFQAALDAGAPVQPVALRYARGGRRWLDVTFRPGESFFANAMRLLGSAPCDAEVHFLPVVPPNPAGRRHMADAARASIAEVLKQGTSAQP